MRLPFGQVIAFAHSRPQEMRQAALEFFGEIPPTQKEEEDAIPLFGEWLIFDYRQKSGATFLAEYCLTNPDNLDEQTIKRMEEAFSSSCYSMFEIQKVKKGENIELEDLYTGKTYIVWDKAGSNQDSRGSICARITKIEGRWYMVGSNPVFMPITHTERSKKLMREASGNSKFTPKDT